MSIEPKFKIGQKVCVLMELAFWKPNDIISYDTKVLKHRIENGEVLYVVENCPFLINEKSIYSTRNKAEKRKTELLTHQHEDKGN